MIIAAPTAPLAQLSSKIAPKTARTAARNTKERRNMVPISVFPNRIGTDMLRHLCLILRQRYQALCLWKSSHDGPTASRGFASLSLDSRPSLDRPVAFGDSMHLQIRNSRVYYETSGGGEPLLLLHGGFGTVEDFASQAPVLAKHFKVVAFERPGHGHTADTAEPFSFDTMAAYTADFIESLKLGAVNLVGWSDGAITALRVAISRPDLVKRLVCIGGLFDTNAQPPEDLNWIRSLTAESFRKSASPLVKRYDDASPDGPAHFPVVVEKTKRLWLNQPNITKEELGKISTPTMVMAGDSEAIPIEHTLELV